MLRQSIVFNARTEESIGKKKKKLKRMWRGRRRRVGLRNMLITPSL